MMLFKKLVEDHLSDRIIIRCDGREWSYNDLYCQSMILGQYWLDHNIKPGDRIVVASDKGSAVVALLACLSRGFVYVPVDEESDSIIYAANNCGAAEIFTGEIPEGDFQKERTILPPETIGYIIYTSGSTGMPKGVVAPFSAIDFCINAINERLGYDQEKILSRLPLFFDYGLYQVFLALYFCCELILISETTPIIMLPQIIHQYEVTALPVVPTMLRVLYRSNLFKKEYMPKLHYITSTGEALDAEMIMDIHKELPEVQIIPMYGLTECKRVSVMPPDRWDKVAAGSCGLPLSGVEVGLINKKSGKGELIVYGPNVMSGYWGDKEASEKIFCRDDKGRCYLRTGDMFSIDDEGYLYFHSRIKNMIKVGGYAISGVEIENQIRRINGVYDVKILGIPDDVYGEKICAFIYSDDDKVKESVEHYSGTLPWYKQIRKIIVQSDPLPMNKNGKTDVEALYEMAGE